MDDMVQRTATHLDTTTYHIFRRAYEATWGAIIDRESGAKMEGDLDKYRKHDTIPQYVAKWCALQRQDTLVEA